MILAPFNTMITFYSFHFVLISRPIPTNSLILNSAIGGLIISTCLCRPCITCFIELGEIDYLKL